MSKIKNEMATRCELALMGKVVEVTDNSEVQAMTDYILSALGMLDADSPQDIFNDEINQYSRSAGLENNVKYLVVNKIGGMRCITYLLENSDKDPEGDYYYPAPFEEDYGSGFPSSHCYVYNVDCDWFSEFGDCFFIKHTDGFYHRVS